MSNVNLTSHIKYRVPFPAYYWYYIKVVSNDLMYKNVCYNLSTRTRD